LLEDPLNKRKPDKNTHSADVIRLLLTKFAYFSMQYVHINCGFSDAVTGGRKNNIRGLKGHK
jgi:hypothetical protein